MVKLYVIRNSKVNRIFFFRKMYSSYFSALSRGFGKSENYSNCCVEVSFDHMVVYINIYVYFCFHRYATMQKAIFLCKHIPIVQATEHFNRFSLFLVIGFFLFNSMLRWIADRINIDFHSVYITNIIQFLGGPTLKQTISANYESRKAGRNAHYIYRSRNAIFARRWSIARMLLNITKMHELESTYI